MRDGWDGVPLGELLVQVKEPVKVESGLAYNLLGVRLYGNGPFIRETVTSETSKATRLFPVQPGDFIYNRLFAWKGSFGLISEEQRGCFVSSEFPLFRVRQDRLDPVLLNLIMCQPSKWAQIEIESTGSTPASRNRWKEDRFLEQVFLLPPIEEQKRIVDVVSSVDAYIDALQHQADTARTARNAIAEDVLRAEHPIIELSNIGRIVTGSTPSTKCPEYWEPAEVDFITPGDFGKQLLLSNASRKVSQKGAANSRALISHSVLQVCIGATIGKVGYVSHEVVTNQQINSIIGLDELDAYFAALMLSTKVLQANISDRAGTTTLPIISKAAWGGLSIPWPDVQIRKDIAVLAKSIDEYVLEVDNALTSVKSLRSGLLSDLLSGEHAIPETYDRLLKVA